MKRAIPVFAALLASACAGASRETTAAATARAPAAPPAAIDAQASGVTVRLRGISAVDANVAWASGREGSVLRTVDGGAHWQAMRVPGAEKLDFRDVEGFDADSAVVLSIGPGADSRVYRTDDGGRSWQLALQNADPRAFFDCMAFDGDRGWMLGDPVDGAFQVYATSDGGRSWALQPADMMPKAEADEAAFAASGTCIATTPWGRRMAVGGGGASRAFVSGEEGAPGIAVAIDAPRARWTAHPTPIPSRVPAAGIFSAAPAGGDMLLVGGDFEHEDAPGSAALAQLRNDGSLGVSALPDPRGYRSGAACA
ncbi:MAG: WD40/YVTN/BNR-like repeat-containing protein, partial [Luteimonas sp.]